jgi:hypothetical protein
MSMKKVGDIRIIYPKKEAKTAELAAEACEEAFRLTRDIWGLKPPKDCRIYVMTSWLGFIINSAPPKWKLSLLPTFPLWMPRIRRTWPYSAAWTQRYGPRIAIGIKPPRLIERSQRKIGSIMLVEEPDPDLNIRNVTCHELIHACSARLILPMWLNEGIALYGTERFSGKPSIRTETLRLIREHSPKEGPPSYSRLSRMRVEQIAYHDSRGYWLVKYLEETSPGFLKSLFDLHRYESELEEKIAEKLGIGKEDLWLKIDDIITGRYLT